MNTIMIVVTPKMNPECLITLYELDKEKKRPEIVGYNQNEFRFWLNWS